MGLKINPIYKLSMLECPIDIDVSKLFQHWDCNIIDHALNHIIEYTGNPDDMLQCHEIKTKLDKLQMKVSDVRIGKYLRELIGIENKKKLSGQIYYYTVRIRSI
jgi:hypothetical protein